MTADPRRELRIVSQHLLEGLFEKHVDRLRLRQLRYSDQQKGPPEKHVLIIAHRLRDNTSYAINRSCSADCGLRVSLSRPAAAI